MSRTLKCIEMKKKILIPTDFSENAYNAIAYANELFKKKKVDFYIFNSYYSPGYATDNMLIPETGSSIFEALKMVSEKKMEETKSELKSRNDPPGHTYHFVSEFGPLLDVMKNTVDKNDIELVVMGSRGETDNRNIIFGTNTIDIMEKIRACPVLAIPGTISYKNPNEIVFPTSFKTHFKSRELNHLSEISKITNAPIRIVHVSKKKQAL